MNRQLFIKLCIGCCFAPIFVKFAQTKETKYVMFPRVWEDIDKDQNWILTHRTPIKTLRYLGIPDKKIEKEILHLIELWRPVDKARSIIKINPDGTKEWKGRTRIRIIY